MAELCAMLSEERPAWLWAQMAAEQAARPPLCGSGPGPGLGASGWPEGL